MKSRSQPITSIAIAAMLCSAVPLFAAGVEQLQRDFDQPPDNARIMVRWWWYGPAVTKPQLEREMKFMKEGGIGGFEVQPTYPLALDGQYPGLKNLKFMSPEHLDMLTFTAAKAKELGLRMDLTLGSGWPYGGPQFTRSEAVAAIRNVGPVSVSAGQTSVALPAGGAGRGRGGGGESDPIVAALLGPVTNAPAGTSPYVPLEVHGNTAALPTDLRGATQVLFYTLGLPGLVQVKRPAFGAEGYIIDHYGPTAIEKFIKEIAEPAIKACKPNLPYAVFCDSLEVTGENWTPNFLVEFQKRRGYDLRPLLPALFNDSVPKAVEIRHDWGRTCTELFNDYFNTRFQKLAKTYNTRFRIQGYGSPPAALYSYAFADLNEAEGYQWHGFDESRWAASASHLLGRPVTSSETWTWLHSPVFMANPLDMKAEANLHFLQGINQLIGHGWPYTPPGVEYPGWRFYAAAVFDEKNPWWIVMPDVAKYLQRCSFMLRQGAPANDVLVFLANGDAWAEFGRQTSMNRFFEGRVSTVTRAILDAGYNLDYCDDQLLAMRGKVKGNALEFGDAKYRVVVLPGVQRIPPATLRKLEEFAKAGGIVIATRSIPSIAPGYKAAEADQRAVKDIAQRLFQGADAKGIFVESDEAIGPALAKRLRPDVAFSPAETDIGFVHRKTDSADIYFIANTANEAKSVKAALRVQEGLQPQSWDPMTGRASPADVVERTGSGTTVNVSLEPHGSRLIVFTKRSQPSEPVRGSADLPSALDLSRGWSVSFKSAAGDTNPATVQMETLNSWADSEATKFFSGVATYEKQITVPAEMLMTGLEVRLDFGEGKPANAVGGGRGGGRFSARLEAPVREAAVVYVNGRRAGSVWSPPYRVDVTGLLKPGENQLRIEVANLAVNYMAGRPQPDLTELRRVYGNRFDPQEMNQIRPMPSGLLGAVRLVAAGTTKP